MLNNSYGYIQHISTQKPFWFTDEVIVIFNILHLPLTEVVIPSVFTLLIYNRPKMITRSSFIGKNHVNPILLLQKAKKTWSLFVEKLEWKMHRAVDFGINEWQMHVNVSDKSRPASWDSYQINARYMYLNYNLNLQIKTLMLICLMCIVSYSQRCASAFSFLHDC